METIRETSDVNADNTSRRDYVTTTTNNNNNASRRDVTSDNNNSSARVDDVTTEAEVRSLLRREYVPSQFDDSRSDTSGQRVGGASRGGGASSSINSEPKEREIVIIDEKLKWNAQSKIGSLQNSTHKPGGGTKKIVNEKLKWDGE